MVQFLCPSCDKKLTHSTPLAKVRCPRCSQRIQVPPPPSSELEPTEFTEVQEKREVTHYQDRLAPQEPHMGHFVLRFLIGFFTFKLLIVPAVLGIIGIVATVCFIVYELVHFLNKVTPSQP